MKTGFLFTFLLLLASCSVELPNDYDVIIRGGTIYDGSGGASITADIGIIGERIIAIGDLSLSGAPLEVDATGLAVAPGFINMLSWGVTGLIQDGRGMSDIMQGVTLEVFGEGNSWGPWSDEQKALVIAGQGNIKYDIEWTTLGEYLEYLTTKGVSPNVASFVGATTLRTHVVGWDDVRATPEQIAEMQDLVRQAMEEGALGVGSSLIYAPANFADISELTALASAAGEYDGMYISHMRSEAQQLENAVEELISIARNAGVAAEIYHMKASGRPNFEKMDWYIRRVNQARANGLAITADMYTYPASSTGLNATMPLWVQEGGQQAWFDRLADPDIRARVIQEMTNPEPGSENRVADIGPENILLVGFRNAELRPLIGRTILDVANERGSTPVETIIDLVVEDQSRVNVVYFSMDPNNLPRKMRQPWVSFGSDGGALASEGIFLENGTHPRAYGNFARLLGKFVREDGVIPLSEAIRRMTSLPATNLKIRDRGGLSIGYFADIVIFNPETIIDNATFTEPHQYATGMVHVFVNGQQVVVDGVHTGALPGQVVRGPGWTGWLD